MTRETFITLSYERNQVIPEECLEVYKDLFNYERCIEETIECFDAWKMWWCGIGHPEREKVFNKARQLSSIRGDFNASKMNLMCATY